VASPGSKADETVPASVKIGDCKLDLAGHTFVDGSGREVRLTRAETALLTAFVDSPRRVLSRDQLRYAVAGRGAEPYDRSVDMLVARLRRKIEPDPKAPRFILSVPGVGYKFDVRPQSAANGEAIDPEQFNRSRRGEAIPSGTPGQGSAAPHSPPVLSCGLVRSTALAVNLDPEHWRFLAEEVWRFLAEEARTVADQMTHEEARSIMRRIALDYGRLAKVAEEQLADQESGAIGDKT
jgi:DNA-binding winged helix-turn-helix (wHTH) protein